MGLSHIFFLSYMCVCLCISSVKKTKKMSALFSRSDIKFVKNKRQIGKSWSLFALFSPITKGIFQKTWPKICRKNKSFDIIVRSVGGNPRI